VVVRLSSTADMKKVMTEIRINSLRRSSVLICSGRLG